MHAGFFDVFHDTANQNFLAIRNGVHIHFNRIIQKPVQQNRHALRENFCVLNCCAHIAFEVGLRMDNLHRAPTQYVTGAHHQGIADFQRGHYCLFQRAHGTIGWLLQSQL